jgi:hypothetical protein
VGALSISRFDVRVEFSAASNEVERVQVYGRAACEGSVAEAVRRLYRHCCKRALAW